MTDSYHFQIEPEPRAEGAKFRFGGVYRNQIGCPCKVLADLGDGAASVAIAGGSDERLNGSWSLATGEWSLGAGSMRLIPGELVQRDGQWVAADSIGPFGSGATLKVAGDKIVGRVEAEALADGLSPIAAEAAAGLGTVAIDEDDIAWAATSAKPEPNRAPLPHFNQRTEFDAFPDYVVFHEFEPVAPLHTSPTTDSAYPAIAGLLRG